MNRCAGQALRIHLNLCLKDKNTNKINLLVAVDEIRRSMLIPWKNAGRCLECYVVTTYVTRTTHNSMICKTRHQIWYIVDWTFLGIEYYHCEQNDQGAFGFSLGATWAQYKQLSRTKYGTTVSTVMSTVININKCLTTVGPVLACVVEFIHDLGDYLYPKHLGGNKRGDWSPINSRSRLD